MSISTRDLQCLFLHTPDQWACFSISNPQCAQELREIISNKGKHTPLQVLECYHRYGIDPQSDLNGYSKKQIVTGTNKRKAHTVQRKGKKRNTDDAPYGENGDELPEEDYDDDPNSDLEEEEMVFQHSNDPDVRSIQNLVNKMEKELVALRTEVSYQKGLVRSQLEANNRLTRRDNELTTTVNHLQSQNNLLQRRLPEVKLLEGFLANCDLLNEWRKFMEFSKEPKLLK